jgi:hypothetical protein
MTMFFKSYLFHSVVYILKIKGEQFFIQNNILFFGFPHSCRRKEILLMKKNEQDSEKQEIKEDGKDEESISVKLNRPTGPRRGICEAGKRNKSPEREIRKPAKKINKSNDDFLGRHPTCQRRRRRIVCDGNCIRRRMPAIKSFYKGLKRLNKLDYQPSDNQ